MGYEHIKIRLPAHPIDVMWGAIEVHQSEQIIEEGVATAVSALNDEAVARGVRRAAEWTLVARTSHTAAPPTFSEWAERATLFDAREVLGEVEDEMRFLPFYRETALCAAEMMRRNPACWVDPHASVTPVIHEEEATAAGFAATGMDDDIFITLLELQAMETFGWDRPGRPNIIPSHELEGWAWDHKKNVSDVRRLFEEMAKSLTYPRVLRDARVRLPY